jgi:hypothetical protein
MLTDATADRGLAGLEIEAGPLAVCVEVLPRLARLGAGARLGTRYGPSLGAAGMPILTR